MKVAPSAMVAFPMRFSAPSTWPMMEWTDLAVKILVDGAKLNASQGPAGALDAAGAPRRRVTMRGIIVIVVVYQKFLRSLKKCSGGVLELGHHQVIVIRDIDNFLKLVQLFSKSL